MANEHNKLWGGRFSGSTDAILERLNQSINLDRRLFEEDIDGSIAYAEAIRDIKLLTDEECTAISEGLEAVKIEWQTGKFEIKDGDEDIHTANERRLKELIGEPASKLHVGRSRNDQVITDMKLWLTKNLMTLNDKLKNLIEIMVTRAAEEIDVKLPGYTHLQRAQPVRWSHYLLSHVWSLKNDSDRLDDIRQRINIMPLGSGAIAGNPFHIDRLSLAASLNFDDITDNSMQAVSDRDFIAEFLFWASLVGSHLSRLAEDLIIYSTKEFEFVNLSDAYSTGSSLMPQKRNPDSLELIRGIGGSLFGECCNFMLVLKGLPSTYNKDLQGDKEVMFAAFDKLKAILEVTTGVVKTLRVNAKKCEAALSYDMLATDVAYYLVRKGVAFREAHRLAGLVVATAERKGVAMKDLTLSEFQKISSSFDTGIAQIWDYETSIEQYQAFGGTAKSSVLQQIRKLEAWLGKSDKEED